MSVTAAIHPPRATGASRNEPPPVVCDKCGNPIGDTLYRCPRPYRSRCERCGLAWVFSLGRHPTYQCGGCRRSMVCYSREPWAIHYCSDACRSTAINAHARERRAADREPLDCLVCHERVDAGRRDTRYCSSACRQKAYRARRSA